MNLDGIMAIGCKAVTILTVAAVLFCFVFLFST